MNIQVVSKILEANDRLADSNARKLKAAGVYTINLMGAPGAGKTSVLEAVITQLKSGGLRVGVIEGDITGSEDAQRIATLNVPVVQINTGGACHLDANMINEVLDSMPLDSLDMLIIENVGNLVCPAEFKVGEDIKLMVLSVTEGDDKPLKYPLMFRESAALVFNKIDLLPYINFNMDRAQKDAMTIHHEIRIFKTSCKTRDGVEELCAWLKGLR
ncbi:MAG: hydrogenase nickel incorporation protein HypB [Nitrospirae bacterium]|nr:hydrogenase nickel incorporation protein HypB [Nitrospirota bacterium]